MSKKYVKKMLEEYKALNSVRFHMPGHKGKVSSLDVTELSLTDNLNNPENQILDAQKALSKSYESAKSYFMVNGSTGAIHSMLKYASLTNPHPILISRNSHKSILAGCKLFNIETVILEDRFDNELQSFVFDEQKVLNAIKNADLSAVVITSVDYFGRTTNISKISQLCRERNILLLCDEAHGAHFHISGMLPQSSIKYADICVHSPHKTLSALTQCSYIHAASTIDIEKLEDIITSLQTSSPSFLLVKSMDDARDDANNMKESWEQRIKSIADLSLKLNSIDGIRVMGKSWAEKGGYDNKDVTRLVIDVSAIGSGIKIGEVLEKKYNIFMEMCSFKYIVGILTPFDYIEWDNMLYTALYEIAMQKSEAHQIPRYPQSPKKSISFTDAAKAQWIKVSLEDCAGEISAVSLGVYPPGVAIILPGEVISREAIEYMTEVKRLGGSIFGLSGGYVNCIKK